MLTIMLQQRRLSGPGNFADMDLLEVGNAGMTDDEQATHFAIWAMFKSPLMVSTRLDTLSSTTRAVLQNRGLIAINQDSLGQPVVLTERFSLDNDQFAGPLANGDVAVLLVDQTGNPRNLGIYFAALNLTSATVTNLWSGEVVDGATSYFTDVNGHGSVPLRLSNVVHANDASPALTYYEAEHGQLAGAANIQNCSGCSAGKKVGYIGNGAGNTLTISGITTSQSEQDVRFDFINGGVFASFRPSSPNQMLLQALTDASFRSSDVQYQGGSNVRGASVSVNGNAPVSVLFPLSGYNWDVNVYKSFLVRLYGFNIGGASNTITISGLFSVSQYAPDIDRIGVVA